MLNDSAPHQPLREIELLLTLFGYCADRGDGTALSKLFFADGTMLMGRQLLRGQEAIAQFTNDRCAVAGRKTRHLWSNLQLEFLEDGAVRASSVQQTFEQNGADQPAQLRVSDLEDLFRQDEHGRWLFQSRKIARVFTTA